MAVVDANHQEEKHVQKQCTQPEIQGLGLMLDLVFSVSSWQLGVRRAKRAKLGNYWSLKLLAYHINLHSKDEGPSYK